MKVISRYLVGSFDEKRVCCKRHSKETFSHAFTMILYRFFLYDREQEQQSRSASYLEKLFSKAPSLVEALVIRFH
jgi:hypothetical protein